MDGVVVRVTEGSSLSTMVVGLPEDGLIVGSNVVGSNVVGSIVGIIVRSVLGDVVVGDAIGLFTIITTKLPAEDSPLRLVLPSYPNITVLV